MRKGKNGISRQLAIRADYCPEGTSLEAFGASSAGIAVIDKQLRFCAVNRALADFNQVPPDAHLGKALHAVIGSVANACAPRIESVFASKRPIVGFEVSGKLPKREDVGYWIEDYFPLFDEKGRLAHVAAMAIEVTNERRLAHELAMIRTKVFRQLRVTILGVQRSLYHSLLSSESISDQRLRTFNQLLNECQRALLETAAEGRPGHDAGSDVTPAISLPERQKTIIQLLAEGRSTKQIADLLDLSPRTVETHKTRIFKKLRFQSLADLTRYAIRNKLVHL